MSGGTKARSTMWIAVVAIAAIGGVVAWKCIARSDGRSPMPTPMERGRADARESHDAAPTAEAAAASPAGAARDDSPVAERTTETTRTPKHADAPVTWVEGAITLLEPAPLPPPPWPDDVPPDLPEVAVDVARLNGSFLPEFVDGPDDEELPEDPTSVPDGDPRRVRVVAGRFRFDARGATAMLVRGLELDHRRAEADGGVELSVDAPAQVHAHWSADVLLHVLDAKTKAELDGVTVAARPFSSSAHDGRVPPSGVVVERKRSPVHAATNWLGGQFVDTGLLWIGADGHAWRPRNVEVLDRGAATVELDGGAALVIEVKDDEAGDAARALERRPRVRLRDVGAKTEAAAEARREREPSLRRFYGDGERPQDPADWLVFDSLAADEPMEFDGLPAGEFVASLELGDDPATPQVLDRASVELVAGATQRVTLSVRPDAIVAPVLVAGTLHVPPAWGRDHGFVLELIPQELAGGTRSDRCSVAVSAMEPVAGDAGWYRWRVGPIAPATYLVRVTRARFETRIDVGRKGRSDVAFFLPEPATLVVKLVDRATQEPVELASIVWYTSAEDESTSSLMHHLLWDPAQEALVGAVASGTGRFDGASVQYALIGDGSNDADAAPWTTPYTVHPGRNEIVLDVKRRCGLDLRVDRVPTGVASSFVTLRWTRLANGDHGECRVSWLHVDLPGRAEKAPHLGPNCVPLPTPGRYRFEIPDWPTVAPFEVDVKEGEFAVQEIELR